MDIDDKLIDRLSFLAKLEFKGQEKQEIKNDLKNILELADTLNDIDTTGVEPLIYLNSEKNILRDDVAVKEMTKKEFFKNAPEHNGDFIIVPKVVDKKILK